MALQKVGAKSVRVQTLSEPEAISADALISLGDDDLDSDLAEEAFSQLWARARRTRSTVACMQLSLLVLSAQR